MSGSSVASDSMSSTFASSSSRTDSPAGDYSPASISRYSSSLSPTSVLESLPETLSEEEIAQIATFYSGLFSEVFVCAATASLYMLQSEVSSSPGNLVKQKSRWVLHISEGVPVIVKQSRPDKKSIHIIFAERGTGFPLYQDTLSTASNYRTVEVDFHDFMASNRKTLIGLRIFSGSDAAKFLQYVITAVNSNANETDSKQKSKRNSPPRKKSAKPKKSTISPPCCFSHIVHISKDDDELLSISQYVSPHKLVFP